MEGAKIFYVIKFAVLWLSLTKGDRNTPYDIATFARWEENTGKSNHIRTQLNKCFDMPVENGKYLDMVLQNGGYVAYLARATGYQGTAGDTQEFRNFISKALIERPRLVAYAIKQIALHRENPDGYTIIVSENAKNIYGIDGPVDKIRMVSPTREHWRKYAIQRFGSRWDEDQAVGEHHIQAALNKLFSIDREACMDDLLDNEEWARFIAKITHFPGEWNDLKLRQHIIDLKNNKEECRLLACAIKQIALQLEDPQHRLVVTDYVKNRWPNSPEGTFKLDKTKIKDYLNQKFGDVPSQSTDKQPLMNSIENLQRDHKDWMKAILSEKKYFDYVKGCLGIEFQDDLKPKDVYKLWVKVFFKQETSQYSAMMLKNIFLHMSGKSNLPRHSNYMNNYKKNPTYEEATETINLKVSAKFITTAKGAKEAGDSEED